MSATQDILDLAELHSACADKADKKQQALGPRPAAPPEAAAAWDKANADLQNQINDLTAQANNLAAQAVLTALAGADAELEGLKDATALAKLRLKHIRELSDLLSTLGAVLDVGVAILALATAPTPEAAMKVADKIKALAKAADGGDPATTPQDGLTP
jgi:uncharacterized BrkB/YihY/UPF0761 family membrane protein